MAISHKRQAQHHLKSAKQALSKGDAQTAQGHLAQADKIAASGIATHTHHANNGASAPQRQRHAKAANDLNSIRHTIKETIVAQNKFPTPFSAGMTQSCPPGARAGAMGIMDAGGYSNAGGLKQAPPGAGAYMRVPFLSTGGDLAANNGQPFGIVLNGAQRNFVMRTPQLSWLQYRLRGIVIERQSNGAALNDIINFEDLRQEGGPNLIIGEGQLGVDSCRMGDSYLLGLRYNPVVTSPNQLELRIRATGQNNAGALTICGGDTTVFASAVIETIVDTTYGRLNNWTERLNLGHFGGGQGQGYVFMRGAPLAGTVQRVPMRVQADDATNPAGSVSCRLTGGVNAVTMVSEQISWAELQIVGLEFGQPIKTVATDATLFEDLQVGGGASLFPQAGTVPAINYLNNNVDRGGGVAQNIGLRHYPVLSSTNTATVVLSARNPVTGGVNPAGNVNVPYVNLLVDRLLDDVYGKGPRGPYAVAAGPLGPVKC